MKNIIIKSIVIAAMVILSGNKSYGETYKYSTRIEYNNSGEEISNDVIKAKIRVADGLINVKSKYDRSLYFIIAETPIGDKAHEYRINWNRIGYTISYLVIPMERFDDYMTRGKSVRECNGKVIHHNYIVKEDKEDVLYDEWIVFNGYNFKEGIKMSKIIFK